MYADDKTVAGLKNDESACREEAKRLRCAKSLNVNKMKEMNGDYRKPRSKKSPLNINGSLVVTDKSTKFLVVHIAENLSWSLYICSITKPSSVSTSYEI